MDSRILKQLDLDDENLEISPFLCKGGLDIRRYQITTGDKNYLLTCHVGDSKDALAEELKIMHFLDSKGVSVLLPEKTIEARASQESDATSYQLRSMEEVLTIDHVKNQKVLRSIVDSLVSLQRITDDSETPFTIERREIIPETVINRLTSWHDSDYEKEALHNVISFVQSNLLAYLPYMESRLCHGDLHPHNILIQDNNTIAIIDWEYCFYGPKLYDLAFLVGCIGLHGKEYLSEELIEPLFRIASFRLGIDQLSRETFCSLVLATRLLWLDTWITNNDREMIASEIEYLSWLLKNQESLSKKWMSWLSTLTNKSSVKWVVQDAVFTKEIAQRKEELQRKQIKSLEQYPGFEAAEKESVAKELRNLVVAFGKDQNVTGIIDMLGMQQELCSNEEGSRALLHELGYTYANASLAFSQLHQRTALLNLIDHQRDMHNSFKEDSEILLSLVYLYRNCSILLSETGSVEDSYVKIKEIQEVYDQFPNETGIAEEYARALSSGIITALGTKNKEQTSFFVKELNLLKDLFSSSKKVQGASLFAQKNLSRSTLGKEIIKEIVN